MLCDGSPYLYHLINIFPRTCQFRSCPTNTTLAIRWLKMPKKRQRKEGGRQERSEIKHHHIRLKLPSMLRIKCQANQKMEATASHEGRYIFQNGMKNGKDDWQTPSHLKILLFHYCGNEHQAYKELSTAPPVSCQCSSLKNLQLISSTTRREQSM